MLKQVNQKENELSENQFKDSQSGLTYEKVTINLPVSVVNYYRAMAYCQNTIELTLIENDIIDILRADLEGRGGSDWKDVFNLSSDLEKLAKNP